jgi:serine protease Do
VTPSIAKAFGLNETHGALVGEVTPDSPAARGGLKQGDIVLQLNGQDVPDSNRLKLDVGSLKPGSTAQMKVYRDGSEKNLDVTLGEMPGSGKVRESGEAGAQSLLDGVEVSNMTPRLARQLNLPADTKGVVVTSVDSNSAAAAAGLREGDVIQQVNRKPVSSVEQFENLLPGGGKSSVLLLVNREGQTMFMAVEPR